MGLPLKEYRCPHCHKLFFKGILVEGEIEVKCRSCHELSTMEASRGEAFMCLVENCPNRVQAHAAHKPHTTNQAPPEGGECR